MASYLIEFLVTWAVSYLVNVYFLSITIKSKRISITLVVKVSTESYLLDVLEAFIVILYIFFAVTTKSREFRKLRRPLEAFTWKALFESCVLDILEVST